MASHEAPPQMSSGGRGSHLAEHGLCFLQVEVPSCGEMEEGVSGEKIALQVPGPGPGQWQLRRALGPGWDLLPCPPPSPEPGRVEQGRCLEPEGRAPTGLEPLGPGPPCRPLTSRFPASALTSEPAQKEIVIRVGQGRQHVLDVFSELGREMRVKVVFTLSLGPPQTQ